VPCSQWYLFNAIPDTNHNANHTNPNRNGKGNSNSTNSQVILPEKNHGHLWLGVLLKLKLT